MHLKSTDASNRGIGRVVFVTTCTNVVVVFVHGLLFAKRNVVGTVVHVLGVATCGLNIRAVILCANTTCGCFPSACNALFDAIDLVGSARRVIHASQVVASIVHRSKWGNCAFVRIDAGFDVDVAPSSAKRESKRLAFRTFIEGSVIVSCHL